jgi:hypothetical protein
MFELRLFTRTSQGIPTHVYPSGHVTRISHFVKITRKNWNLGCEQIRWIADGLLRWNTVHPTLELDEYVMVKQKMHIPVFHYLRVTLTELL